MHDFYHGDTATTDLSDSKGAMPASSGRRLNGGMLSPDSRSRRSVSWGSHSTGCSSIQVARRLVDLAETSRPVTPETTASTWEHARMLQRQATLVRNHCYTVLQSKNNNINKYRPNHE